MTQTEKTQLADLILSFLGKCNNANANTPMLHQVGVLNENARIGIKGFKPVPAGTPVFKKGDMYAIVLETISGNESATVTFYKESLAGKIEFILPNT